MTSLAGHSACTPSQTASSWHGCVVSGSRHLAPAATVTLPVQHAPPNWQGLGLLKHDFVDNLSAVAERQQSLVSTRSAHGQRAASRQQPKATHGPDSARSAIGDTLYTRLRVRWTHPLGLDVGLDAVLRARRELVGKPAVLVVGHRRVHQVAAPTLRRGGAVPARRVAHARTHVV